MAHRRRRGTLRHSNAVYTGPGGACSSGIHCFLSVPAGQWNGPLLEADRSVASAFYLSMHECAWLLRIRGRNPSPCIRSLDLSTDGPLRNRQFTQNLSSSVAAPPWCWGFGSVDSFLVIYSLVPYVYFLSLRDLSKIKDGPTQDQRKQLVLLNLVGLDLCLAVSSGPTFFRLCTVAPPALLLCVVMIYQPGEVRKLARYTLWCVSVASMIWLPIHRQMQWHRPLLLPTGKITFTDKGQWQEMGWLLQRTSPGDIVFNQSAMTLYLGLENPTHAEFVNNDDFTSVQDVKLILDALQKHPAKYVVLGPDIPTTPHDHAGPFRDYIHAHYCLEQTFFLGPAQSPEGLWRLSKETPHIQGGNLY